MTEKAKRNWATLVVAGLGVLCVVAMIVLDDNWPNAWLATCYCLGAFLIFCFLEKSGSPNEAVENDTSSVPFMGQVLSLAFLGAALLWLAWGFYESRCATNCGCSFFCDFVKDSKGSFFPLLAPLASVPSILFWWIRRDKHKRKELTHQDKRLLTERFSSAVTLLGHQNEDVRMGAIYALERLAHDSWEFHWPVIETLAAYVRRNASLKTVDAEKQETISADVQAVLTVIGRRKKEHREKEMSERKSINLSYCFLKYAKLEGEVKDGRYGHFETVDFKKSDLQNANFSYAILSKCNFTRTILKDAIFFKADLNLAALWKAKLEGSWFQSADLRTAILVDGDLDFSKVKIIWENAEKLGFCQPGKTQSFEAKIQRLSLGNLKFEDKNASSSLIRAKYNSYTKLPLHWGTNSEAQEAEAKRRGMINVGDEALADDVPT